MDTRITDATARARELGEKHGHALAMPYSGERRFMRTCDYLDYVSHEGGADLLNLLGVPDSAEYPADVLREVLLGYCEAYWLATGAEFSPWATEEA